jgi:hypothetical protein
MTQAKAKKRTPARRVEVIDQHAARDLELTIENDGRLYESQQKPIILNLMKKRRAGTYRHDLAVKLFGHLVESGAKKYAAEYRDGGVWHVMFNVPTRRAVAESLTRSFETEADLGNYDHLLPHASTKMRSQPKTTAQIRNDIERATGMKIR